ncbi:hypothetical protein VULLAG_LOCUS12628 [Vulpes lagopus]
MGEAEGCCSRGSGTLSPWGHWTPRGAALRQGWTGGRGSPVPKQPRQAGQGLQGLAGCLPFLLLLLCVPGGLEFEEVPESGFLPAVSLVTFHLGPHRSPR